MKMKTAMVALLAALAAAPAWAGAGTVGLSCLPSAGAGVDMRAWLLDRLALKGAAVDETRPQWKLCFKQSQQRQVYWPADGWYAGGWRDWRYGGGMYWSPDYQVRTVRTLALEVVNSADGTVLWQGQQELGDGDNGRQQLENAARKLIDLMPLP
ncbi:MULTISPECIES: DUF4136 domain-containing protein [Chromobacterium]|nr:MULTISPECIES: DUF4136 domain-containing protein [Chromobacterium]MDH0341766.1 DUF4136 domain-containing protein [Chromobacterium haemolyticum]OQS37959.1 hypothetical protein B0T40_07515 [Chromobacterium haemolyticum]QOD83757.1 DUF4136 domain-containing protein [Chromobacterium haemolyticum]